MLATLSSESVVEPLEQPVTSPHKGTLLIVDDEEGPRQSLRVIFKDDYDLLLACNGSEAVDLTQKHNVDVVVLDIRMAGMSGIEVLERLKFVDPNIEVVIMTAFETADSMKQALRLRASDYINKPFDISTMRAAVAKAMERRSLANEVASNLQRLRQLQADLQQTKLAEELVRTRGEIYASIIHDINGPLTVISGQIQMINQRIGEEAEIDGEDLEVIKDRLKRITRQVTTCIEISRRYLSFLRQNPTETVRVWVNQILGDLGELLRSHPSAKTHHLIIHPLAEDVTALINGTDLIQILLNLTLNALQCTAQPHRVEISGQLLDRPLDLAQFQDGPEDRCINCDGFKNAPPLLSLAVQDNGAGISPEILPRIFEPYFTTQPRPRGTGLGLCIVQRLLKEAHGALHVHSKLGQGSVFTIYLPARMASADPAFKL